MRRLAALLVLLASAPGVTAQTQERITSFHSDVAIVADGSLMVTETIVVEALGQSIRRGILRDIPTEYRDRAGNRVTVPLEILQVTRDGDVEGYATESLANGLRIRIGRADVMLPHGAHRYEIRYRTARQLGFFAGHDELYWNATGNGWTFAIERASASVRLPQPVPAARLAAEAYTGSQGARGTHWQAAVADGRGDYQTTRALAPHEGLTVVLTFPKGIVTAPSSTQKLGWFIGANQAAGVGGLGVLLLGAGLYARWRRVGRDPQAGPLFPRYEPPPDLSPAAVRFVSRMGYDTRCFAAGVLGLGARGYLKIDQDGDTFTIRRIGKETTWLPGDWALAEALFHGSDVTTITKTYDSHIAKAQAELSAELQNHYQDRLFTRNTGTMLLAAVVAIAIVALTAALRGTPFVIILTGGALAALLVAFWHWMPRYSLPGRRLRDEIDGLRQYLGVAERAGLSRMQAPELTPSEFARMLPYALALEVEETWADRFAAVAGRAAAPAAVTSYYHSDSLAGLGSPGSLGASLGEMGAAVSAASTPPGSSSGSGGGGSSGGGGGGGGGSGW